MKISVFSLWRDAENYIQRTLSMLEAVESQNSQLEFSYFFYENDSRDNTAKVLSKWLESRAGRLLSEKLNFPSEGSVYTTSRMLKMCYYRNRMINIGRFIDSDYSIVFDSDILFDSDIVSRFLSKVDEETIMYTPYITQNIKCKLCRCGKDSYYDVAPLFDKYGQQGLHWACNPFSNIFDRQEFGLGKPVEIKSGFGGFAFFKSFPLNFCNWRTESMCDHILFCEDIRRFGKIKIYPDIHVKVELSQELLKKYGP